MDKQVQNPEVLSKSLFDAIKKECPQFLSSYYVLSKFHEHLTTNFTHKVWKDGRIVLTPKKQSNEQSS